MKSFLSYLLLIVVFAGCGRVQDQVISDGQLYIVTTTGMIADAVTNIGGDSVRVESLMGPGVDPHLYKATQGDLKKLIEADIIFYNGVHLEGKMGEVLEKLSRQKRVIAIGESLDEERLREAAGFAGTYDPHLWFNVLLWRDAIRSIEIILSDIQPDKSMYFKQNADAYFNELTQLDQWVRMRIEELPPSSRILVTAHDAFGYFGDAYGFTVRGLQGLSTLSEFGLKDVSDLVNYIVENRVKAVFVETSVPKRSIDAVVAGCRERGFDVRIGGNLFSDAMGAEGTPEGTYVGMVQSNVNTIVDSLL
ncbi:metal ABC transporter solute-binding protein, Zn/Mn family [Fulvivirga sedimenti]|uniref:Zinc ABC transporter substrate-binding protein n=1 Tax=Fulvivirga sedimenti TaxID=2879465 RepID=A0A9X1HSJ1_9BACT|nr:zinc ABC transporter substrate-binding protein [Fulvivirga sedimenti]MCA6074626.1 zinc ABC transporter substrate-binding protein [Fulvivirga sedimenti]MCA6075803.1 zinc ABC transporter substrate-binding protein [Fulvivirga sedimenti]MCA6076931.1 zinc ABC transporter substrate-binding protein [Fulvivirga sedimenti]